MNLPTIIGASIVLAVFISIIYCAIINKKNGKSSCSCSVSCKSCNMNCSNIK